MAFWLHQLSEPIWSCSNYRLEIWENNIENWRPGKIFPAGGTPAPGDIIVFYYAEARAIDCGIFGWGIILRYDRWHEKHGEEKEIRFRIAPPSDYLKMNPLWDDDIKKLIGEIKSGTTQGSMWEIEASLMNRIREKITEYI